MAHQYFPQNEQPAGYSADMQLRVPHGCGEGEKDVKEVRVKIPDSVTGVSVYNTRDWTVEIRKRKLPQALKFHDAVISDTVDEIVWKNPRTVLPGSGMFETFLFRVKLPNDPGKVLWFKSIAVCDGDEDRYVDVPKDEIRADGPDFVKKIGDFETSVEGPAPYIVLTKPEKPQYPWESLSPPATPSGPSK
jgi:uncharacterized protein YcnI